MDKKAEIELLNKEVERLRTIATVHKEFICNSDITPINLKNNTKDGSIISLENKNNEVAESLEKLLSFKSKFDLLESPLILFPDQELINKLVQLGFSSEITKWFVKIDDLLEQLNRLNNNESIIIDSLKCFNLIFTHLRMGFLIALIKGFDFIAQYENNKDSNIVNSCNSLESKYN